MRDLGTLGGHYSFAEAINDRGQVIGASTTEEREDSPLHAFMWENGNMTDLGTLGGDFSTASAINDHGRVVGLSTGPDGRRAFLWENGHLSELGAPGRRFFVLSVSDINEQGQSVGEIASEFGFGRAYLWQDGAVIPLGRRQSAAVAINERGQIVGWSNTGKRPHKAAEALPFHAALWTLKDAP
jgi:probable HAF family extracellular repeat protein